MDLTDLQQVTAELGRAHCWLLHWQFLTHGCQLMYSSCLMDGTQLVPCRCPMG